MAKAYSFSQTSAKKTESAGVFDGESARSSASFLIFAKSAGTRDSGIQPWDSSNMEEMTSLWTDGVDLGR